jgi:hypothetical protein
MGRCLMRLVMKGMHACLLTATTNLLVFLRSLHDDIAFCDALDLRRAHPVCQLSLVESFLVLPVRELE